MREKLKEIDGIRARFRGTFERFGERTSGGYVKRMALLQCITDTRGTELCDHLWLNLTLQVERLALQPGDRIEFDARVRPYTKGYYDHRRRDYRLSHPTLFTKIGTHDAGGNGLLFSDAYSRKETA